MRKTDRKLDNQLTKILTIVCETRLKKITGFLWVTHLVNYANFPKSLKIICVFDTDDNLSAFKATTSSHEVSSLIQKKLFELDINISTSYISFVTEVNFNNR